MDKNEWMQIAFFKFWYFIHNIIIVYYYINKEIQEGGNFAFRKEKKKLSLTFINYKLFGIFQDAPEGIHKPSEGQFNKLSSSATDEPTTTSAVSHRSSTAPTNHYPSLRDGATVTSSSVDHSGAIS